MLGKEDIQKAFAAMGAHLRLGHDVEILVIGGAAGILLGELAGAWTTQDVDVVHCKLPKDREAVLDAAAAITRRLSLPPAWLNDFGGLYAWTLPEAWESRRVAAGTYGELTVYSVSRTDLIAMKFVAHRTRDLEHLARLGVTAEDLEFTKRHLSRLMVDYPEHQGQIEMAGQIASTWSVGV